MNLGPDMVRDQPDDPLTIGGGHLAPRIGNPGTQPVDPKPPVGIEHHFDGGNVFEPGRDLRSERGTQHACATCRCFGAERIGMMLIYASVRTRPRTGCVARQIKGTSNGSRATGICGRQRPAKREKEMAGRAGIYKRHDRRNEKRDALPCWNEPFRLTITADEANFQECQATLAIQYGSRSNAAAR